MNLKDQAQQVRERLAVLQEHQRREQDARALDHRRLEWHEMWAGLQKKIEQLDWMGLKQFSLKEHARQVAVAQGLIVRAEAALAAGGSNDALTEDGAWAKLEKSVAKTAEVLAESVRTGWSQLVRDAGEFRTPAAIAASLPLSRPGNREALAQYRESFGPYDRLARQEAPASRDDVLQLRILAERLKEAVRLFNFDQLPDAVRIFFAEIDSGRGAPLRLLTDEVRNWLDSEGQSDRFVVKSI